MSLVLEVCTLVVVGWGAGAAVPVVGATITIALTLKSPDRSIVHR